VPPAQKVLILDFGNVVGFFDHRRACARLAALGTNGVTADEVFVRIFRTSLEPDYDSGRLTTPEFLAAVRQVLGSTASDAALGDAWSDIFWPNEDVVARLPAARRVASRILLASNTNELHFQRIAAEFAAPLASIDEAVLSFRVGACKPAPVFFERCLSAAGADPGDCIYVDDRPEYVEAARRAGMTGFVYTAATRFAPALAAAGLQLF
jgi:FMN phosphatase YigB (HAD superfamily)